VRPFGSCSTGLLGSGVFGILSGLSGSRLRSSVVLDYLSTKISGDTDVEDSTAVKNWWKTLRFL